MAKQSGNRKFPIKYKLIIIRISILLLLSFTILAAYFPLAASAVNSSAKKQIFSLNDCPVRKTALVLGAYVDEDGRPCAMLYDRIKTAILLYRAGKVKKLLMTGDHGLKHYNEVGSMRAIALNAGIPPEDIFTDHAGFSTYESIYRAKAVFLVDNAVIITQEFHLPRSLYMAKKSGINAAGVPADLRSYEKSHLNYLCMREFFAKGKDFFQINVSKPPPAFLGPAIPIDGDGRVTHDDSEKE